MTTRRLTILALLLAWGAASAALAGAAAAAPYDPTSWYEADYWGGEYPPGFTMATSLTTPIRTDTDPNAPRSVDCALEKGATYQPWNGERVASARLEFITYSPIVNYQVSGALQVTVTRQTDNVETTLSFADGDAWDKLIYVGEGSFLMRRDGVIYMAGQDLMDAAMTGDPASELSPDEWLGLDCANGASGWLLLSDVVGQPGFDEPNITGYGTAADKP